MTITLRNYQQECLDAIKRLANQGTRRQLISIGTGGGKTVVFASLIRELCKYKRIIVVAHTHELLYQAKDKLLMLAPDVNVGLVDGSHKEFSAQVVIVSVQSACIEKNLKKLKEQNFELFIYDECHHSGTDTARKLINELGFGKGTKKLLCGFTATGWREDGKGLGEVFDVVAYERSTQQLIDDGFLVAPKGFKIATNVDLTRVKTVDGDFHQSSLAAVMDTPRMNDLVIKSYIEKASGRPAICFGVTVQHARNLADGFIAHGIPAKAIDGKMATKEREQAIADFKAGNITVLCNCQILSEGVDLPHTSCVIVARPTRSRSLMVQMCGRGLRPWMNKSDCVILDFSDLNHNICSSAILLEDGVKPEKIEQPKKEVLHELPPKLNPQLKAAIVGHDVLGQSFTWAKNKENAYVMRGGGISRIEIKQRGRDDRYSVMFYDEQGSKKITDNLNFEWSFSAAEDFARANRKLFTLSDKEAAWRNLPISEKQKDLLKRHRFKSGIDDLTRGQAKDIIASGILFRGMR